MGDKDTKYKRRINFEKLSEFIRNPNFSPLEKVIVVDLILYAGVNREPFPSQKTLAKDLNRSERYIRKSLYILRDKGIISWFRRGYSRSNQYSIEELYFRYDLDDNSTNRNYTSDQSSNIDPQRTGNPLPPNEYQYINEETKNEDHKSNFSSKNPRVFTPCGNCENGLIFKSDPYNEVSDCDCKIRFDEALRLRKEQH